MSGRSLVRHAALVAVVLPLAVLAFAGVQLAGPNLTVVDPGSLYRSGQLSETAIRGVIRGRGIRTVINLRGRKEDASWYRKEAAVARAAGVELIDVRLSSRRIPDRQELLRLLDAFRDAKRPILVHCFSGGDRGGLASAVYAIDYMGASRAEALDQLRLRTLHLSTLKPAMRSFVSLYEGDDWARESYHPCAADYEFFPKDRRCPQRTAKRD